jgi:hypothetical protein
MYNVPDQSPLSPQLIGRIGDVSDLTTWTSIEVSVGLFCASAPAIRPLIRKIAPNLFPSVSQSLSRGGTLRQSGTKHALSKRNGYVHGTMMSRSRRGVGRDEAFELDSWDEGDFGKGRREEVGNTFWVRTDSDEEERRNKKKDGGWEDYENSQSVGARGCKSGGG